ncbi:MAG TPA: sialidase family protein [Frankiaceae bacterium]|nr:sialidase family protein [Frankiaceae bacterium]
MRRTLLLAPAVLSAIALAVTAPNTGATTTGTVAWEPPVLVTDTQGAREMSMVLDPTNEQRMFACTPSGLQNPHSQSHYFQTADGGDSWTYTDVETDPDDTRTQLSEGGDCDVAYDSAGTMYVADTWVGNLSVGTSRDGGATWTGTALAVNVPVVDRPWLVAPGAPGVVYVTYQALQGQMPTLMWFTKSTDYGRTFSPAVPITTANLDGTYTWEGNVVTSPDGQDIYLIHSRRVTPAQYGLPDLIQLAYSHDGGTSWRTRTVETLPAPTTPGTLYPGIAMDAGGHLHAVWSAPRDTHGDVPVYYTTSADKGVTWSEPIVTGTTWTAWAPWVAGGRTAGEAAIAWLGTPSATPREASPWYFGYATVSAGAITASGTTTEAPMFTGVQTYPEFQAIRYDSTGRLHLGMAVFGPSGTWSLYYQRQALPTATASPSPTAMRRGRGRG